MPSGPQTDAVVQQVQVCVGWARHCNQNLPGTPPHGCDITHRDRYSLPTHVIKADKVKVCVDAGNRQIGRQKHLRPDAGEHR
jgi:hypothetical protein